MQVIRGLVEAHVITEKGDYSTSSIASGTHEYMVDEMQYLYNIE
jgi:hypothetical protein